MATVKNSSIKIIATNRKARYNYEIISTYEAGMVLKGSEIKSILFNNVNIKDSFVLIRKQEAFIINMNIPKYKFSTMFEEDPLRQRKLLLHKAEIKKITHKLKTDSLTLVPLKIYFKNGYVKLEFGLGKGKKVHDKRQAIKERDEKRYALRRR
ncbi:SsrA-binding protein SmpB [Spiroplasma endosymbiont of Anurida maritima]|uniref:SsrA-binding protein SmpB n=1 Tax=Spiroplasma endosymbiont of Anurida maritima TaxID=2967972 RepID=UPI0036D243F6